MRISPTSRSQICITMGDPSGIGPEVIMKSMASASVRGLAIFCIFGDAAVMAASAHDAGVSGVVVHNGPDGEIRLSEDAINIIDPSPALECVKVGSPTFEGSRKALECLSSAVESMLEGEGGTPRALVTAPLSKELSAAVHPGFTGHTEYLQQAYDVDLVTMVLTGRSLCVVPVTRHIPLRDVAETLTSDLIFRTLVQVADGRELVCGKPDARIGVAALNPHCGEGGRIGLEEIDVIAPAVLKAKEVYANIEGPLSADVIFYKAMRKEIDIVVAMYHDQALAPFKMLDFDHGVNMTLGLGHVRTSPDHGTAFDIAGKGIASPASMEEAIKLAVRAITA